MPHMKVRTASLKPNPFRDFSLYPIDKTQVQRLAQSIDDLGWFQGIPVRKDPDGGYQMMAGHHRHAGALEAGLKEVEVICEDYDDDQAVAIMVTENLTQRGYNAASVLDSVAAYAYLVTYEVLLGEGNLSKFLDTSTPQALGNAQTSIAKEGPGARLLYRAMNGFDKGERSEHKTEEIITETEIQNSLAALKASGKMAKIVAEAFERVEAERAEIVEAEERRIAKLKDEKAQTRARAKADAEAETHKERKKAVGEQKKVPATYDARCVNVFRLSSHEKAFRKVVLGENGLRFIPKDKQLALAKAIREEIDAIERRRGLDLGAVTIGDMVNEKLMEAMGLQRGIDKEERLRIERENALERVRNRWRTLRQAMNTAEGLLEKLVQEQKQWSYEKELFPMDYEAIVRFEMMAKNLGSLKKRLGM